MSSYAGDYRSISEWGELRTVCHGCRAMSSELVDDETGGTTQRPVLLPGDGQVMREVGPGMMVSQPCPACGDSEDPGWVEGFTPPV